MSRSYRYSPESGNSKTGGEQHNKRRCNRRERRLVSKLAAQADSFVLPPRMELSANAGFRSERHYSTPANSASRR